MYPKPLMKLKLSWQVTEAGMSDTDVLIVGAGLAGLPIAMACAQAGWRVVIVDQSARADAVPTDPLDQRCTAIGSSTVGLLQRWGVWQAIEKDAQSIQQVHVSQRGFLGSVRLRADELGVPALGYVIENRQWVSALTDCVTQLPNITVHRGEVVASVSEVSSEGSEAHEVISVGLESGERLNTRLLIAADGVNSRVRDLVGIGDEHVDYEQCALMSTVQVSEPHGALAVERFTRSGPLAMLPRPGNVMSVVWCLDPADAKTKASQSDEELLASLQSELGFRLGRMNAIGAKTILPLIRREATRQVGTRTVLLGNAVRLLHPVAGQGFNLALRDVAGLLDFMGQKTDQRSIDPGSEEVLHAFQQSRQHDQQQVVSLTDTLAKTFRGDARLPGHFRALGFIGLDNISPLRKRFALRTMGYTG